MREIRIYQPTAYQVGQEVELSAAASQHIAVVLRMQAGEKLTLFCGDNREFIALITAVHKKKVSITILSQALVNRESPRGLHLAQAISKGERMEFVVQKAVELGVTSLQPLITERCVVKLDKERMEKKLAQWQAIAIAACEQCGRNQLPLIAPPQRLDNYLPQNPARLNFILHPEGNKTWRDYDFGQAELGLLIGPEGGFSEEEIKHIFSFAYKSLNLGPRILRTETAALAALSLLQGLAGDL